MKPTRSWPYVIAAALAIGCASGAPKSEAPTPALTVTPTEWSVAAGGAAKQFTASLTGSSDAVGWSIETAGTAVEVGTISGDGLYTPPALLTSGRDVVVKASAGALVARATVHLGAGLDGVTLSVAPAAGEVVAGSGGTVTLTATTNYVGTVGWSVAPTLGTLDTTSGASVVFTAPTGLVTAATEVVVTATAGALTDPTTLTVHPTLLVVTGPTSVHAGGSAVDFTLVTDAGGNAVAWSVVPSSAGTISGTGGVGTFTPPATAAATVPFQVVATIGGATGSASADLYPPATPVNVVGRIVDWDGGPHAGATVIVGGTSVVTDADGAFTIASVAPPYDLTVVASSQGRVRVLRGVMDVTPTIPISSNRAQRGAQLSGTVTSGAKGVQAGVFAGGGYATSNLSGAYTFLADWRGDATRNLTVRALRAIYDMVGGKIQPVGYELGSTVVAVTDGVPATGLDVAVSAIDSGHVTGTCAAGPDYDSPTALFLDALYADGSLLPVWHDYLYGTSGVGVSGTFDWVVPSLPGGQVRIENMASALDGAFASASAPVIPGQTGVTLEIPPEPKSTAPANAADGVGYGTAFTWSTTSTGGTNALYASCGFKIMEVFGGPRSTTIPDLSSHGVTIDPGTACTWYPLWLSYSVDDLAQGAYGLEALPLVRYAEGEHRTFTF